MSTPLIRTESDWLLTYTGKAYWPLDPQVEDVCLEDIAHGLSLLCRYAGQVKEFYSVAEHCFLVSCMVPAELALEALLHDASEAYCSDVVRPLKKLLPDYRRIEQMNDAVIRERFGLPFAESEIVKQADTDILLTEAAALLPPIPAGREWNTGGTKHPTLKLFLWSPKEAERAFLERYEELTHDFS